MGKKVHRSLQMKRRGRERVMVLVKMFYAAQKVYVIDMCMPIIFHANFSPSCSFQQVASLEEQLRYITIRHSLTFVNLSASTKASRFARLIMRVISSAADARNMEIFSPRKRKCNFHGCILSVGLCSLIPLCQPRSNLMIMRKRERKRERERERESCPMVYSDFIACEMWPFFLL